MASPYSVSRQQHRSQPASPIVGFNPIGSSQQPQQPQSSHPGSPVQNLHSSASNSSLRNSLLSGNYAFQQQHHKPNPLLTQHQSHPSLSSLAAQQQQQQQTSPAAGPAALAYANAQLDNFAALQQGGDNNQAAAYYAPSASTPSTGSSGNPALSPQQQQGSSSDFKVASPNSARPLSTGSSTGAAAFAPQMTQLPPGLDMSALNIHSTNSSAPASAASSPGWSHRRLPSGSHHFVGGQPPGNASGAPPHPTQPPHHNPRVAASAVTGKRLNWGEMIAATIYHSEHGRLVIQDLFSQMCSRFPEVQEWAFGKDWEGRVKNRIKSTLSIKGHLFVKVPRPSSAAGKGSWWTLSQEAQEAVRENRLAPLLKLSSSGPGAVTPASHSRSGSRTDAMPGSSALTSAANSRYNSPGPASGAATPVRHFAAPHPLTPSMDTSTFEKMQQQRDHEQQQAQQAAHLQKLQAHLLRQQEQQREALPESYDPNAPPSFSANLPPGFYNVEGMAGLSSPVGSMQGGPGSAMDQQMYSSSMDRNLLQALQTYGSSFGGPGQNNNGNFQGGMDIDKAGNSLGRSANDTAMTSGSFGSNSFDATWRSLTMTGLNNNRGNVPNTNFVDWKSGGMSDPNVSDSVDSASASSNSGYTNTTGGGRGTGSSSSASASSYGIGSPQSIAHLGGPQSMPFPAAAAAQRSAQQQGINASNNSNSSGQGLPGGDGNGSGQGVDGQAQGRPRGSTFDFGPGPQAGIAMAGTAGPSGMLPFAMNSDNPEQWASQLGLDQGKGNGFGGNGFNPFSSDGSLAIDGTNAELFSMMQNAPAPNPFGMRLAGGYAMPIPDSSGRGPHPYSHQEQQQRPSDSGQSNNGDGSIAWSQGPNGPNSIPPPSPAGSFSSFFAYTPATGPIDTPNQRGSREGSEAGGAHGHSRSIDTGSGMDGMGGGESALGPMIGSRRRTSNAGGPGRSDSGDKAGVGGGGSGGHHLYKVEEGFSLPPPATG